MKKPLFALLLGASSAIALAAPGDHLTDLYFSDKNPTLTPQEKAAIAIAEKWKNPMAKGIAPVTGPNGSIKFLFGAQQPSIVCAVLQVCDVALQAGEQVNSINLGDTARWTVEPAVTGSGAGEVQHLIIKPLDVGLETSMVVTTNRRTITCGCARIAASTCRRCPSPTPRRRWRSGKRSRPAKGGTAKTGRCREPASTWAT
jgi:hypothetical protein